MDHFLLLAAMVFLAAILYSSVGHAGASGYLAAMALLNVPPDTMKPTALCLNIVVATIGTIRYARANCFSWRIFWPFAAASIPLSFVGGALQLPGKWYKVVVGMALLVAALRLLRHAWKQDTTDIQQPSLGTSLLVGGSIGLLSGLTGTGGGIFLSPILLLAHWTSVRECAGVTVAFVLVNSIAGLAGNLASVRHLPPEILYLVVIVVIGALIGSELGSRRLAPYAMRYLLGIVLVIAACKLIFT
jgi:uncharacterized membrane protein YfcA